MHTIDPKQLSPSARQVFKLIEFDPGEKLVYEVRKHWFGLFLIYATGSMIIGICLALALGMAFSGGEVATAGQLDWAGYQLPVILLSLLMAALAGIGTAIGVYLYRSNVILVTTDKVAQLLVQGIFHKKISQLSIRDVQDVTVRQYGIFPHLLHYGTVVIETAGEQNNYIFTFAPDPYKCAQAVITAQEENTRTFGN